MNTILLTDLVTGLLDKGPDYVFLAMVFAALFIIWHDHRKTTGLPEKVSKLEGHMEYFIEQSREIKGELKSFKEEMKELREEIRADNNAFREEMRADNNAFKEEMKEFREEMRADNKAFREEMRADNKAFREEMREEFKVFREEINFRFDRVDNRLGNVELQLHEIKSDLKLHNHKIDNHETRITKLENPTDSLKSKQA